MGDPVVVTCVVLLCATSGALLHAASPVLRRSEPARLREMALAAALVVPAVDAVLRCASRPS